jgi:hypothetical protein
MAQPRENDETWKQRRARRGARVKWRSDPSPALINEMSARHAGKRARRQRDFGKKPVKTGAQKSCFETTRNVSLYLALHGIWRYIDREQG